MNHLNGSLLLRLCEALPDIVFLLDQRGTVLAANKRAVRLLKRPGAEIVGRALLDLTAGDPNSVLTYFHRCARSGAPLPGNLPLATPSGTLALHARGTGLMAEDGTVVVFIQCTDKPRVPRLFQELNARLTRLSDELHRRRRLQSDLQRALEERELLLKEVHHRVRNNLQVVSSFLSLQAHQASSEVTREVLREAQTRIRALGLIHGQLYSEHRLGEVDFGQLVPVLCTQLASVYGVPEEQVAFSVTLPPWPLELGQAVPVALLITEAVTNALKHAYPQGKSGTIRVRLEEHHGARVLCVGDDGVGLPEGPGRGGNGSLGMRLMRALTEQVEGQLEIRSNAGVEVRIALPAASAEP